MDPRPTVLLVSAGSLVGRNVLDALGDRRSDLCIVATNSDPAAPALAECDVVEIVPETVGSEHRLETAIKRLYEAYSPTLVIPCRDDDVLMLATAIEAGRLPGVKAPVGNRATAEAICDGLASARFSEIAGLPFGASAPSEDRAALDRLVAAHGFPLVAKPRRSFGSHNVRLIGNPLQLAQIAGEAGLLVQAFVGSRRTYAAQRADAARLGDPLFHTYEQLKISLQAMISPAGEVIGVSASKNEMKQGFSMRVTYCDDADALALANRCATAFANAGWRGPLNVQTHRNDSGTLQIFEFGGRFNGVTAARAWFGYDEVQQVLREFAGVTIRDLNIKRRATEVRKVLSNVPFYG